MRRLVVLGIPALLSFHNLPVAPPFEIDGRPVHPACVYELLTRLSDLRPIRTAVDVQGCIESDEHSDGEVSLLRGGVWYRNPSVIEGGYLAYWLVGTTPHGVHVLETCYSGGGSGIFMNVLLVRLSQETYVHDDGWGTRWILTSLGEITLGDRSDKKVTLQGETLRIRDPDGSEESFAVPFP
jgi:hypothetical protein